MNLTDKLSNTKVPDSLDGAFKGKKKEEAVVTEKKKKVVKKPNEASDSTKDKKVNVSYTINESLDKKLRKHVLELKLQSIDNEELADISASSIVNELIDNFLKENN